MNWPSSKAGRVLAALMRIGWQEKRRAGSHSVLQREGWPDFVFAFHEQEEIGTVIAKEKLSGVPHGSAEGVAFMVKRDGSAFPDSDGWEFLYFPSTGDKGTTQKACASCHHAARSRDYVFGEYPR